jgi:predicted dehydrogenase/threonine dehydrogenase-like Zn-dependent dehydrogenase
VNQILQSLRTGATEVADVPCPAPQRGHLLILTSRTLISAGTERMLVDFGRASFVAKARQQPEKVRQVLEKLKTDGFGPTWRSVRNKLDQPLATGYCNAGEVIGVGEGVSGFAVGDRVVSNGKHAEVVAVPANLCAKIPDGVSDEAAAFAVLGGIALQGVRLVQPTLGETMVVTGLGLIGLVTVQLLRAHGCRVLGLDFDPARVALARSYGAAAVQLGAGQDPVAQALAYSRGRGVDGVVITASTRSSQPVHEAALMCRKRGRIVLVGVTGLELLRDDFYRKELTFQVSCSYGPGRYDPAYEDKGHDYPLGFVRWTAQRNFEAVLDMMSDGRLKTDTLVSHRFAVTAAAQAYDLVASPQPSLGVLLEYAGRRVEATARTVEVPAAQPRPASAQPVLGFIGAGNYATAVLLPAFRRTSARLRVVASAMGVSGLHAARKFGIERATTDVAEVLGDPAVHAVVITTRHDSHAGFVAQALAAGKHVFVEKPLALTRAELGAITEARAAAAAAGRHPVVMVGFNRRFAPQIVRVKALLARRSGPLSAVMTVNAGTIPGDHWTQDRAIGGGRIIGEACHFIDLLRHLVGQPITAHVATKQDTPEGDTATITLQFGDGSIGTIHYFANGSRSFPKERLEVFAGGAILQLDNFRRLTGFGWPGFRRFNLWQQDKGQQPAVEAFLAAIRAGTEAPIPWPELLEVSGATIDIAEALSPRHPPAATA